MIQKKIRSLIYAGLGLVLCVLLCGGIGMTAQAESYGDLTYEENESGIKIDGYTGNKTKLVIPEEIAGKKVTSIGNYAFYDCSSLTSVTIPAGVTSIGGYAFSGCSGLTSITIPKDVTSIGYEAFARCSGLTSITIPKDVTSIGSNAFGGCSGLTSITIPTGVTSIVGLVFSGCSGLTSITIPAGVTSIDVSAFLGCSGLTSIKVSKGNKYYDSRNNCNAIIETKSNTLVKGCNKTVIPDSVTSIGNGAFRNCSGLTSIIIPKNVTSIGNGALSGCSGLTSIKVSKGNKYYDSRNNCNAIIETKSNTLVRGCIKTVIPDSVTSIGGYAFYDCSSLTSVTIPAGVTSIGGFAFSGCSGLTSITIPKDVTSIGSTAFYGCNDLTSMIVDKGNKYYDSRNNCNAIIETKSNTLVSGCKKTVIPDSVTSIGSRAFYGCSSLTSITIPKSVTSIGDYAFGDCSGLKCITISKSVTNIGEEAFTNCGNFVISCYKNSAAHKYAIENNIPVKLIGKNAAPASGTPAKKGTTLTISSKKLKVKVTSSSKKNPTVTITKFTDKKAKKLTIPATVKVKGVTYKVTAISDKAFKGNKKLTTATIGKNVTKIGKEAFAGCKNLKKIKVTAGKLKTISKNAFKSINKKASITVKGTKKAKTALKKQLKKKSIGYVKTWKIK